MGVKIRGARNMSSVDASIGEARRMSNFLLAREFRGPGDTIEAAAHRAEQKWGAPASLIQRLRHREVTDMLLSNWLCIKSAYDAACELAEAQAQHQEFLARAAGKNENNSIFAKSASLVAGPKDGAAE